MKPFEKTRQPKEAHTDLDVHEFEDFLLGLLEERRAAAAGGAREDVVRAGVLLRVQVDP